MESTNATTDRETIHQRQEGDLVQLDSPAGAGSEGDPVQHDLLGWYWFRLIEPGTSWVYFSQNEAQHNLGRKMFPDDS